MAALTTQTVVNAGVTVTYASAAGGGDTFVNTGQEFLHVKNGSGGDITVTIGSAGTYRGVGMDDLAVVVPAGSEKCIKPYPAEITQGAGASTAITYSGVTSLTIAVIKFVNQ